MGGEGTFEETAGQKGRGRGGDDTGLLLCATWRLQLIANKQVVRG